MKTYILLFNDVTDGNDENHYEPIAVCTSLKRAQALMEEHQSVYPSVRVKSNYQVTEMKPNELSTIDYIIFE